MNDLRLAVADAQARAEDTEAELGKVSKALDAAEQRLARAKRALADNPRGPALEDAQLAQDEVSRCRLLVEAHETRRAEAMAALTEARNAFAAAEITKQQAVCDEWPAKVLPLLEQIAEHERQVWELAEQVVKICDAHEEARAVIEDVARDTSISVASVQRPQRTPELSAMMAGILIEQRRQRESRGYIEDAPPWLFIQHQPEPPWNIQDDRATLYAVASKLLADARESEPSWA